MFIISAHRCGSHMRIKYVFVAIMAALILAASSASGEEIEEITVFAAASLTGAFSEIGELYEDQNDIKVELNFDGSQALRTQLENGAYADVFASANNMQMNALMESWMMNNKSIVDFAGNRISLIIPKNNPASIRNLTDLARPGVKIVMGTKDVPVGDYSLQVIARLGDDPAYGPDYKEQVLANIISQETNVNYVVTKVALGEADAGFAYESDISKDMADRVDKIDIPDEYNIIAHYPMGILLQSRHPAESQEFIDLVLSDDGRRILKRYGFMPPENKSVL